MRRRRNEGSVELRKTKKEEHLWKKRNIESLDNDETTNTVGVKTNEVTNILTGLIVYFYISTLF